MPARVRRSPYRRKPGRPHLHGGYLLTRALRGIRLDTIDRRSQIGCVLRKIQESLTAQLGGPEEVTPAQALLIEQAAIKAVIVQAVGEYVLKQECPVDRERHALVPVVMQHDRLQATFVALLDKLGLGRVAQTVPDIRRLSGLPD